MGVPQFIRFAVDPTGEDGFGTFAPLGSKLRCHARPAGHEQQSTGLLHLNVRISSVNTVPTKNTTHWVAFFIGGPEEIRTPDPYNANVMRSQLRYRPIRIGSA